MSSLGAHAILLVVSRCCSYVHSEDSDKSGHSECNLSNRIRFVYGPLATNKAHREASDETGHRY